MHGLLACIHSVHGGWQGSWALSIVILTVFVRLLLLLSSRKQTAMSMRMMEVQKKLQPEFDKLHEKYKDDLQHRTTARKPADDEARGQPVRRDGRLFAAVERKCPS